MKIGNLTLKRLFTADGSGIKYSRMYFILIVIIVLISGLYLRFAWKRYQDAASSEVIMLAQSLESLLHPDHIAELTGSVDDLEKPEYQMTKTSLMQLTETTNPICYAYIMGIQNDSIIFLLDSQSPHSPNYSPPGQIYTEANNTDWEPFKSSSTVLTKPTTDRWGTWISALVPIKDPSDDRVIAVLGIDYSVLNWYLQLWKQMIPDVIIVICLLMLFFTIVRLLKDITIRKKTEATLRESERSKSVLLSHLPGLAYRCSYDHEWTMQYVSAGCLGLTGYPSENLLFNKDMSFNDLIAPDYRERLWEVWARILPARLPFKHEYEIITASGERKWVLEMGEGLYDAQGNVEALEGIIIDITDRKKIENALKYTNEHDRWTGLFNRTYFENLLKRDVQQPAVKKRALVGINLSTVYSLATTYGFDYTQDLIKKVADALALLCTENLVLFSTYESLFVFFIRDYKYRKALVGFCEAIENTIAPLLEIERISAGIGIVEVSDEYQSDVDQLLRNLLIASEKALAINDGDIGYWFYDEIAEAQITREAEIKHDLTQIVSEANNEGLFLQYQPIVDLKSNQICGFEALARLNSEKLGLISPLEFIPIAEKTKLIIPIGKRIIRQAFQFLNIMKKKGFDTISISINVSAIQLARNEFYEHLYELINEMQINPENVILEITESVIASDHGEINRALGELKDTGLSIAIDDFGTGYSSLARERELNIDCLKIDKSFIDKLMYLEPEKAITGDIISMAHRLGHYVVAEGVEYEEQRTYLIKNGCDKIQGYLISKPLGEDAALEMLSSSFK